MTAKKGLPLSYANPTVSVFVRRLAWERYVAQKDVTVKNAVTDYLQAARRELGIQEHGDRRTSGAADDLIQKLRSQNILSRGSPVLPVEPDWNDRKKSWRLLYLPPHDRVRQLSVDPVVVKTPSTSSQTCHSYLITLRDPAVFRLRVFVGPGTTVGNECAGQRGIYFLRSDEDLYVGRTDELEIRLPQHLTRKVLKWCVFLTLEETEHTFSLDALAAAEALLISFWNETSVLGNINRGTDREPAFLYLQQAVLLAEGASAALLWLARNNTNNDLRFLAVLSSKGTSSVIPFKPWRGRGWPDCYLAFPNIVN